VPLAERHRANRPVGSAVNGFTHVNVVPLGKRHLLEVAAARRYRAVTRPRVHSTSARSRRLAVFLSMMLATAIAQPPGFAPQPTALAVTGDGKLLFAAMNFVTDKPGAVYVWNLTTPELSAVVPGVPAGVVSIHPTADGARFVVATIARSGVPGTVEVYDTATKKLLHTFDVTAPRGAAVAVSPDAKWVAARAYTEKAELTVWSTETGKRADAVEKAAGGTAGTVAFVSGKLVIASREAYAAFDPATGKALEKWKPAEAPVRTFLEGPGNIAVLPNGKGMVSVAATGKRRQSYTVSLIGEKTTWFLGEAWDHAGAPVLSPDGRLLILSVGSLRDTNGTYALKLDADGAPELTDAKDDAQALWGARTEDGKRIAWRAWELNDAPKGRAVDRGGHGPLAFSPDGARLFVASTDGRIAAYDATKRARTATLFAGVADKATVPAWHIVTAANEAVGAPAELEALVKTGKVKDAAKVKAALGAK
jgi:WD40 repeat protein